MVTIEDILRYIETKAATIPDLVGKIKVQYPGEPLPEFKDYGLRVSFSQDDYKEIRRNKIGPIVSELYRINVDFVFNKALKSREAFSHPKGLSYWENLLSVTFMNQRNGGLFKDSYWAATLPMEINADSVILRGILNVHLQNLYI